MLSHHDVERLLQHDARGYPVLSVFLGLDPGVAALRSLPARLKELLGPVREHLGDLDRDAAQSLGADMRAILDGEERLVGEGEGVAIFACSGAGLFEVIALPARVRERAIVADAPYLRPLEAMLEELHRYCAVVLDRRRADIFRFYLNELSTWEQIPAEELRKSNFGGFSGYAERRVRARAEEVALKHYRATASRVYDLYRDNGFDQLLIGGSRDSVDGLVAALHTDLHPALAGTFSIDVHTMTPALVLEHCRRVATEADRVEARRVVDQVIDVAKGGGSALLGVDRVLEAVNQRAVDLLVVDTTISFPGAQCAGCGWLATAGTERCPVCGEAAVPVPDLVDVMARAVRDASGSVKHVMADTPLGEHQVGAFVRFPVTHAV